MYEIIDAPEREERILNYAGFWIQVAAYLIDSVVLWIVNVVVSYIIFQSYSIYQSNLPLSLVSIVIAATYFALMESSERQGTLGKMAVGIKVGNNHGDRITFANALGRYLGKFISGILLLIGFLMVAWDDRKQGLHDKFADTYVFEN